MDVSPLSRRSLILFLAAFPLLGACAAFQPDPSVDLSNVRDARGADFANILTFARYAGAAYRNDAEISETFPNTVRINEFGRGGARYFLERSDRDRTQTISVRGTRSWADRLHDVEFRLVNELAVGAAFHRGFEADARRVYADVRPFLRPNDRIRVTGHSLGAAVSAILTIYMLRDGFDVMPGVNFGQPKFTNRAGAVQYADLPILRVVNRNDVVPMLPPRLSLDPNHGSYAHIGEEIILLDGPDFVHLTAHDAERLSVDDFWRDRNYASRADHPIGQYLDSLDAKRTGARQVPFAAWKAATTDGPG
jgi:triacylglycerol lipase